MKEITITMAEYENLISDRARCLEMQNYICFLTDLLRQITHDALATPIVVDSEV